MAHFAQLDKDNKVINVIVIDNKDVLDENGNESEAVGIAFCHSIWGGNWVQTSYNANSRGKYAAIGDVYDKEQDIFVTPTES